MTPKDLEQRIRALLQQPMADAELRGQLEALAAAEVSFSGFTWLFGPELYPSTICWYMWHKYRS